MAKRPKFWKLGSLSAALCEVGRHAIDLPDFDYGTRDWLGHALYLPIF